MGILIVLFLLFLFLVSILLGEPPANRPTYLAFYGFPCALSVILMGSLPPASARLRLGVGIGAAALVFVALAAGDPLLLYIESFFLYLLPVLIAFVVVGPGRFQWKFSQLFGATLVLYAAWTPIYLSFPALTRVLTARGVLEPYSVAQMYHLVGDKFLEETFYVLFGVWLLVDRFPWVQRRVPHLQDLLVPLRTLEVLPRLSKWVSLSLAPLAFMIALGGSIFLQNLLSNNEALGGGTDDTHVFERVTPVLVVLLSLAAGVGEELIFRGVLQSAFERAGRTLVPARWSWIAAGGAIALQAFLFGVVHAGYGNLTHVLLPLAFGLLMGVVARVGGLLPAIYAHAAIDFIAFGYDTIDAFPWMEGVLVGFLWVNYLLMFVALVVLAVGITLWILRRRRPQWPAEAGPVEAAPFSITKP